MSIKAMNWVWECSKTIGTDRLVLLAIADRASDEGMDAWPSIGTLAKKTRLHVRTVQRCIRNVEALGELEIRTKEGTHGTNVYIVRMDALALQSSSRSNPRRPPLPRQRAGGGKLPPGGGSAGGGAAPAPPPPGTSATGVVAPPPPDSSGTSRTTSTSFSKTAASPRALSRDPNTAGNYRVIEKLAIDVLNDEGFETDSDFHAALKSRCARLGIAYGPPDEDADVVHRACASAKVKRMVGRRVSA